MPINMRSHGHGQGYTDLNFIIPESIKTVQYQKGAYYADIGNFSGAGSVEFITSNALEQGKVQATIGDDSFLRAVVVDSIDTKGGRWLYAAEANQYDGPWSDINEDIQKLSALLKYQVDLDHGGFDFGIF